MALIPIALAVVVLVVLFFATIAYVAFWILVGVFFACVLVLSLVFGPGVGFLAAIPVTALVFWLIGADSGKTD